MIASYVDRSRCQDPIDDLLVVYFFVDDMILKIRLLCLGTFGNTKYVHLILLQFDIFLSRIKLM